MVKKILVFFIFLFAFLFNVSAKQIDIHLFYKESCLHCHEERTFLDNLKKDKENIVIHLYEINDVDNKNIYNGIQKLLKKPTVGVPYTIIGSYALVGFSSITKNDINHLIEKYENEEYRDIVSEYIKDPNMKLEDLPKNDIKEIDIPILGKVNPKEVSLGLVAMIIGLVDGFNPCAMWILIFLISMLIGMKNKKRMWILGLTFITTSALVYMLFMLAWLNVALFANKIDLIRVAIALFAVMFGIYNIYKFMKKPKDGCEVVGEEKKKSIILKIKDLTSNKSFLISLIGIITLAISVNVIELLCSLGLPVTFTNILAINDVNGINYGVYILIYIFFFMLDDLIIFLIAMFTLKVTGISTKYARYSSLIGGIIMLIIGILMVFAPNILMFNI